MNTIWMKRARLAILAGSLMTGISGIAGVAAMAAAHAASAVSAVQATQTTQTPDATSETTNRTANQTALSDVRDAFMLRYPGVPLQGVAATPYPGLYELHIGNDLLYADAQVNYLMQGTLIDAQSRTDLTAQRLQVLNRIDFSSLPLDLAIKQVQGSGKRQLAVFEDPNCRYCKLLHQTLAQIDDVTIYTFLFPILSEDSADKARNIWCAADKVKTWRDWMRNDQVPATAECDTPVATLLTLGRKLRVNGTPALFFQDGTRVSGALPPEALQAKLDQTD